MLLLSLLRRYAFEGAGGGDGGEMLEERDWDAPWPTMLRGRRGGGWRGRADIVLVVVRVCVCICVFDNVVLSGYIRCPDDWKDIMTKSALIQYLRTWLAG